MPCMERSRYSRQYSSVESRDEAVFGGSLTSTFSCYCSSLSALYEPAAVGNLKQQFIPCHPNTGSSSISRSQLYVKKTHLLHRSINNKVIGSSAKRRTIIRSLHHTLVPPSPLHHSPSRSGISNQIDCRSEGHLMAITHSQTVRERTERGRRKCFIVRHPAMTTD
jgi:hypothetical protein